MTDGFGTTEGFGALMAVRQEIGAAQVTGRAGDGLVTVTGNGLGDVTGVSLSPEIDRDDLTALESLLLSALADLAAARTALVQEKTAALSESVPGGPGEDLAPDGPPRTADGLIDLS